MKKIAIAFYFVPYRWLFWIFCMTNSINVSCQKDVIFLQKNFVPTKNSVGGHFVVDDIVVNGNSLYRQFLRDSTLLRVQDYFSITKKLYHDADNFVKKLCEAKVAENNEWIDSVAIQPDGQYFLMNNRGRAQLILEFETGLLQKIYFFNQRGTKINEIADFKMLRDKQCSFFEVYSKNWKNVWEVSLVTLDEQGKLYIIEPD